MSPATSSPAESLTAARIGADSILRSRRDIQWQRSTDGPGDQWYAFDPLARTGYRCGQAQRWLFLQFDGRQTLLQIREASRVHASLHLISLAEIEDLSRTLLARGLVQDLTPKSTTVQSASAFPKGRFALPREVRSERAWSQRSWSQWLAQSVSWRVRGVNPHRWLTWLAPHLNCLFTPQAVAWWMLMVCAVTCLVLADFSRLMQQATLWDWFMRPATGSTLLAIFMVTRAAHELGHALVLTRLGGRCPDIGLIFMLGAPCVYCDVTDCWRFPSARHRALVAAGGMYAELIIAALAGIVWLSTIDGVLNTLALQTMIVCSISTIMINANPLMRFDGYYILSDWLNEPNLRTKADRCAMEWVRYLVTGGQVATTGSHRAQTTRDFVLALFSGLGVVYRLSLSTMMASVIVALYAAWNFEWLGRILAVVLLFLWWVVPTMKLMLNLVRSATSLWARVRLGAVAAWLVLLCCAIPLPCRQSAKGWVQPTDMQGLYVQSHGRLEKVHKHPGDQVRSGELIAQLSDAEPRLRSIQAHHAADKARVQLVSLKRQRYFNENSSIDISGWENTVKTADILAAHADSAVDRMNVRATSAGTLISMPAPRLTDIDNRPVTAVTDLWLDGAQAGRVVPSGTMLGAICGDQRIAVVPLTDVQLRDITIGSEARLRVDWDSNRLVVAHVSDIVRMEQLDATSRLLAESLTKGNAASVAANPPASHASGSSASQPAANHSGYAAIIPLESSAHERTLLARPGAAVNVVFVVPSKTLARRATEWTRANARWLLP